MPESVSLPRNLGRYRLVERIAIGGMAEIYRAVYQASRGVEKTVVIKRILPSFAHEPEFVSMFVDEARLMAQLSHPKIVQVTDFGELDGDLFMALELVEGVDALALLRACSRRGQRLAVPLACFIVAEILDALAYAHTAHTNDGKPLQLIHRDISPSNIFIDWRGYVKLGDFGIARINEEARHTKTRGTTLKGKYGYMAPEQVVTAPLDHRVDIFAVGIVLAEMLIGRRLFSAPNDLDVLLMVREANLERLDRYGADLSPDLRTILNTALQRAPAARFPTAAAFRDTLLDYLFRGRYRVGHAELARFLEEVRPPSGTRPSQSLEGESALDGPQTRAARAEAASVQRRLRAAAHDPDVVRRATTTEEAVQAFDQAIRATPATRSGRPDAVGSLLVTTPTRLIARLAADSETGLLVLQHGQTQKEIFFVRGEPEYVVSNVPSERLGEYLLARKVISAAELSMVLAIMPRFNHKMGDTLVGLGLLQPLEVFRHLSSQVRDTLTDLFSWREGEFRYFRGRVNKREAFPVRLDPFEIIGAGVAHLPLAQARDRLLELATARVRRVERSRPTPGDFRLGTGPRELWEQLDGGATVGEWMRAYSEPSEFLTLCRTLYLLIETDLAVLE